MFFSKDSRLSARVFGTVLNFPLYDGDCCPAARECLALGDVTGAVAEWQRLADLGSGTARCILAYLYLMVYFEFWLDCEEFLELVLCIDDVPVAIGAVSCHKSFGLATAWLTFGMVSPAHQGKGLGSALVLARLSLLPKPTHAARVLMTNVEASKAFYARFGFAPYGASLSGRPGLMLPCNSALIGEREWQACRERVASLGLTLPTIEAPRRIARSLATARVTGLTQLVLVELFGLIVLFTVDRPYNWLGALFILCGQYLQRLERRRLQKRGEAALRRRYGHSQIP